MEKIARKPQKTTPVRYVDTAEDTITMLAPDDPPAGEPQTDTTTDTPQESSDVRQFIEKACTW